MIVMGLSVRGTSCSLHLWLLLANSSGFTFKLQGGDDCFDGWVLSAEQPLLGMSWAVHKAMFRLIFIIANYLDCLVTWFGADLNDCIHKQKGYLTAAEGRCLCKWLNVNIMTAYRPRIFCFLLFLQVYPMHPPCIISPHRIAKTSQCCVLQAAKQCVRIWGHSRGQRWSTEWSNSWSFCHACPSLSFGILAPKVRGAFSLTTSKRCQQNVLLYIVHSCIDLRCACNSKSWFDLMQIWTSDGAHLWSTMCRTLTLRIKAVCTLALSCGPNAYLHHIAERLFWSCLMH